MASSANRTAYRTTSMRDHVLSAALSADDGRTVTVAEVTHSVPASLAQLYDNANAIRGSVTMTFRNLEKEGLVSRVSQGVYVRAVAVQSAAGDAVADPAGAVTEASGASVADAAGGAIADPAPAPATFADDPVGEIVTPEAPAARALPEGLVDLRGDAAPVAAPLAGDSGSDRVRLTQDAAVEGATEADFAAARATVDSWEATSAGARPEVRPGSFHVDRHADRHADHDRAPLRADVTGPRRGSRTALTLIAIAVIALAGYALLS